MNNKLNLLVGREKPLQDFALLIINISYSEILAKVLAIKKIN